MNGSTFQTCDINASCKGAQGCQCNQGYVGNGVTCASTPPARPAASAPIIVVLIANSILIPHAPILHRLLVGVPAQL